jgi:uncharacterized membrane protein
MTILILGLALFFASHLAPLARPDLRAAGVARLGAGGWKIAYTLAAAAGIVLIVLGYGAARDAPVDLWFPPTWTVHANNLLMVAALGVYIAGPFKGAAARAIRHPQLTGVKIWAVAHLLANGDLAALLLFGGFLGWAVASVVLINKRDGARAEPAPAPHSRDLGHAAATVATVGAVGWLHAWLGVWPFPG